MSFYHHGKTIYKKILKIPNTASPRHPTKAEDVAIKANIHERLICQNHKNGKQYRAKGNLLTCFKANKQPPKPS